jgi:drug/metabolite transporter (DMT)-like permease
LDGIVSDHVATLGRPPLSDLITLGVAVAAISTSAPLIAATTVPALAISFYRCLLGSGLTAPWAWVRHRDEWGKLAAVEIRGAALAGLLLALHFATWISSLRYTSVASSTALVSVQPVWAALLARRAGVYIDKKVWIGISLALVGVVVLTGIDFTLDSRSLFGDLLALLGGMLSAAYVTAGERVRQTVSNSVYTTIVYAVSAGVLLVMCGLFGTSMRGFGVQGWVTIVALTLGAQLLGHTLINRVLRTTSATFSSLAILLEMPGAVFIAALWLGQVPPASIIPAISLLFAGLVLVIRGSGAQEVTESPPV